MQLEFIMVPVVVWICVTGFYKLIELYARRRERMAIIEKVGDKFVPELLGGVSATGFPEINFGKSYGALKIGCLLLGLGVGLLVGLLINTILAANGYGPVNNGHDWQYREMFGVAYSASVLVFGGIGLLAAFLIEIKLKAKEKEK
ncbi:MAG: hypothetical protein LBR50_10490 [Tannerella sp.]|jgi:MFS family permease|nr:hypothetical protein [Tannerella sp.]